MASTGKKLRFTVLGSVLGLLVLGFWMGVHAYIQQREVMHMKQIPFNAKLWQNAFLTNLSAPNDRAAMSQSVAKFWPPRSLLQNVLTTLRAPDGVAAGEELGAEYLHAPSKAEMALLYHFATRWDGSVSSVAFFFDASGKLIRAQETFLY